MRLVVAWHAKSCKLHSFFLDSLLFLNCLAVIQNHLSVEAETWLERISILVHRDLTHFSQTLVKLDSFRLHVIIVFRNINLLLVLRSSNFGSLLVGPSSLDKVLFTQVVNNMLENVGSKSFRLIDDFFVPLLVLELVHLDHSVGKDIVKQHFSKVIGVVVHHSATHF